MSSKSREQVLLNPPQARPLLNDAPPVDHAPARPVNALSRPAEMSENQRIATGVTGGTDIVLGIVSAFEGGTQSPQLLGTGVNDIVAASTGQGA